DRRPPGAASVGPPRSIAERVRAARVGGARVSSGRDGSGCDHQQHHDGDGTATRTFSTGDPAHNCVDRGTYLRRREGACAAADGPRLFCWFWLSPRAARPGGLVCRPEKWVRSVGVPLVLAAGLAAPTIARAQNPGFTLSQCRNGTSGVANCTGSAWHTGNA